MKNKENFIKEIITIEKEMFTAVNPIEACECLERLHTFEAMREMSFSVWSKKTLSLYHEDLMKAKREERNLVIEKYALMDSLIEIKSDDELIDEIINVERKWLYEANLKYPHTIGNSSAFACYLRGELQTYSQETVESYAYDIWQALSNNRNLVKERYLNLYKKLGFISLDEVEMRAKG